MEGVKVELEWVEKEVKVEARVGVAV